MQAMWYIKSICRPNGVIPPLTLPIGEQFVIMPGYAVKKPIPVKSWLSMRLPDLKHCQLLLESARSS